MRNIQDDKEFIELAKEIMECDKFVLLKDIKHHLRTNRYTHSLRVAYYSYRVGKRLKLNIKEIVRGGLLHDMVYVEDTDVGFISHPFRALENSLVLFELDSVEMDIISKHMFPSSMHMPKYKESWVICLVDKVVAIGDLFIIK